MATVDVEARPGQLRRLTAGFRRPPAAVTRLAVLDSVPIAEALDRADARFAAAWWHWFFFAQPDKPERHPRRPRPRRLVRRGP